MLYKMFTRLKRSALQQLWCEWKGILLRKSKKENQIKTAPKLVAYECLAPYSSC